MTDSSPVFWLLSIPSIITLLARRDWPLTFEESESCELKNSECGLNGRDAPGTVASMPWKLRPKPRGMAAICSPWMMRPVSERSVWRAGDSEVTVSVSARSPGSRRKSTRMVVLTSTWTFSRTIFLNPVSSAATR